MMVAKGQKAMAWLAAICTQGSLCCVLANSHSGTGHVPVEASLGGHLGRLLPFPIGTWNVMAV
jgi:hypothetical protein